MVSIDNLSVEFSAKPLFSDISYVINDHDRIALVGKNGAGKSTAAKLLTGIIRPNKGKIEVDGKDTSCMTIKEIGEQVGYVMQDPNIMIVKDLIKDEVGLALTLRNMSQEQIDARVKQSLEACGLYKMRNWPVDSISYGQKKRVTIASILVLRPKMLLLDEPTAGQDLKHYTEIMDFLAQLNQQGVTVVLITHDMHLMLEYTPRAVVFHGG